MPRQAINNARMPKPLGPYAPAVAASGELVFISGQPGLNVETGEVPTDFESQARAAFDNLAAVARGADLTMADMVKTTIYLSDASHFESLNALFGAYFPFDPPTRAVPIVLLPKGLLISIEAIAARP